MSKKVFISYRRKDERWATNDLYRELRKVLPKEQVFMDFDSIPPGVNFVRFLEKKVEEAEILLAVIGERWLDAKDPKTGRRRLENQRDWVRIEIRQALARDIPVVPVLLDGIDMPPEERLPEDICELTERQFEHVSLPTFEADVQRLIRGLGLDMQNLETEPARPPQPRSGQARAASPLRRKVSFPVPEMVRIEPGTFEMGSDPNEPGAFDADCPKLRVHIARPFELGKYAVTFDEYDAFCRATGRDAPDDDGWGRGRRPVINVSHEDASAYAAWLEGELGGGWRLPSEAEWEYACRAGTTGPFSFEGPISPERVNYNGKYTFNGSKQGEYRHKTIEVGSFPANPWGLHEMHGNVWEWCADCWHESYEGAPGDGSAWMSDGGGDCDRAVVRGGWWNLEPENARSAARGRNERDGRNDNRGFRVARTLPG